MHSSHSYSQLHKAYSVVVAHYTLPSAQAQSQVKYSQQVSKLNRQ